VLHGLALKAVGKHGPDDDVLFQLPDGRPVVVHLTYCGHEEPHLNCPATRMFQSWEECLAQLWEESKHWD
jgi:hypothetical protein